MRIFCLIKPLKLLICQHLIAALASQLAKSSKKLMAASDLKVKAPPSPPKGLGKPHWVA